MKMHIVVGSESPIKLDAVRSVFPNHFVNGYAAPSHVPDQPIGKPQTLLGAANRALNTSLNTNGDVYIGIENGIYKNENSESGWADIACIFIMIGENNYILWSDDLYIPRNEIDSMKFDGSENWSKSKDPHSIVTQGRRKRVDFIRDCLKDFVEKNEKIFEINQ